MRHALQQPVLGNTFDAELALHEGVGSERRAQRDETLLIQGQQRPIPDPNRVTALGLELPDALWFLSCGIPGLSFGVVEADARMLPQSDFHVLIQLEHPSGCINDIDVVQEGENGFAVPAVTGQLACKAPCAVSQDPSSQAPQHVSDNEGPDSFGWFAQGHDPPNT